MATDFSAKQIRVAQIIASGGMAGTTAGLSIYSASMAPALLGAVTDTNMFSKVGSDVFLFVSGTANRLPRSDVSLFGGDVVISGTLYAERTVVEVDEVTTGSLHVSGTVEGQEGATFNVSKGTSSCLLTEGQ